MIQTNALMSWGRMNPKPDRVVVFVDEEHEGAAACSLVRQEGFELGEVKQRSPRGVPLVSDLFSQMQESANNGIAVYTNADIILSSDFVPGLIAAVEAVKNEMEQSNFRRSKKGILLIARRWNVQVFDHLDFADGWYQELWDKVHDQGSLMADCAIDLFAWHGEVWVNIPDFAIGRYAWDNWLVGNAYAARNVPVVDVTPVIKLIHQSHHIVEWSDPDAQQNFKKAIIMGGMQHSTHTMTEDGLVEGWRG